MMELDCQFLECRAFSFVGAVEYVLRNQTVSAFQIDLQFCFYPRRGQAFLSHVPSEVQ